MKQGVIFDLDGTLLQTLPDIGGSMNRVLSRFGLDPHPIEAYKTMVGNGAMTLTERAVGSRKDLTIQVYEAYRKEYAAHTCDSSYIYPGITELLAALRARGIRIAVFSNKDDPDVRTVIHHYFPVGTFSLLRGRMPDVPLKPAPDGALMIADTFGLQPSDILYVGDTGTDMDCGHNAGMMTVGVTWGFRTRDELLQHRAFHVIDQPLQLLALLDEERGEN